MSERAQKQDMVPLAAAVYSAMLAVGLIWGLLRDLAPHWYTLRGGEEIAIAIGAGVGAGLAGVALAKLLERWVTGVRELSERFSLLLAGISIRDALLLALFSSVGEELLFRGCLQQEIGLFLATALFALMHVGPDRGWLWWTASAFVYGLGLGLLYESQGGLLAPILMHFVINAVNISILARRGAGEDPGLA